MLAFLLTAPCRAAALVPDVVLAPKEQWWAKPDWWTAVATTALVVVGIAQLLLFLYQLRYIRETLEDTKVAADAARDSAKAAMESAEAERNVDRAYVFATVTFPFHQLIQSETALNTATVTLRNYGQTPAVLVKFRADHFFCPGHTFPSELGPSVSDKTIPDGLVIPASGGEEFPVNFVMPGRKWAEVENINEMFGIRGLVNYKDVFGATHETGFCWHFGAHQSQRVLHISPSDLNFRT
jgi:hypothetical protein